jgi:thiamine-phosphate pyrophosphorylase
VILYYITDRTQFPGTEDERRHALLERIAQAAKAGVDFIQLREKDLAAGSLEKLTREALTIVHQESSHTRLLINSRVDVALAVGADGAHLTSNDINAAEMRRITMQTGNAPKQAFIASVACHSAHDVRLAEAHGADYAVLAPIFGKQVPNSPTLAGMGLGVLRAATQIDQPRDLRVEAGDRRSSLPVLALGGINAENARDCMLAGAAGVAGIRIFQEADIGDTVAKLRKIQSVIAS